MIRVELWQMLRRPRTWVTIAALNALPAVVAAEVPAVIAAAGTARRALVPARALRVPAGVRSRASAPAVAAHDDTASLPRT